MITDKRYISLINTTFNASRSQVDYGIDNINDHTIFDLDAIQRRICSISFVSHSLIKNEDMNVGSTNVPLISIFQSSDCHSDASA